MLTAMGIDNSLERTPHGWVVKVPQEDAPEAYRQLTLEQIQPLIEDLQVKVEQLAEVFSLKIDGVANFSEILLKAYSQLSAVTTDFSIQDGGSSGRALDLIDHTEALAAALDQATGQQLPAPQPDRVAPASPPNEALDPGLAARLSQVVSACRQTRTAVSLLLIELEQTEDWIFQLGPEGFHQLIHEIEAAVHDLAYEAESIVRVDDARFAIILGDCDRSEGVQTARHLVRGIPRWCEPRNGQSGLHFSAGLATLSLPPRNFPVGELVEAAERCLYAARSAGGGVSKSIEI